MKSMFSKYTYVINLYTEIEIVEFLARVTGIFFGPGGGEQKIYKQISTLYRPTIPTSHPKTKTHVIIAISKTSGKKIIALMLQESI